MQNIDSRAFISDTTEYYELQIDLGRIKKGAIFYYDPKDFKKGNAAGCLKLAWKEDGGCQHGYAGDCIVFHPDYRKDETMFKRVKRTQVDSNTVQIKIDEYINLLEMKTIYLNRLISDEITKKFTNDKDYNQELYERLEKEKRETYKLIKKLKEKEE